MGKYVYGALSDTGDVRMENQDSILCLLEGVTDQPAALFLIADGMGGLSHGAYVSQLITDRFQCWWQEDFSAMLMAGRNSDEDIKEMMEQELWDINQEILRFRHNRQCRCGSTISLLLLYKGKYYIENMGDSRIYLLRKGHLTQLTKDQSLAAQLVREGRLTEEEARNSEHKNVLTMCLGMFDIPHSFFLSGVIKRTDVFLLCSDGLYNALTTEKIKLILKQKRVPLQKRVRELRDAIPYGDGRDNISIIAVSSESEA